MAELYSYLPLKLPSTLADVAKSVLVSEADPRYRLSEKFCRDEDHYVQALCSMAELYGYPLRKVGCLSPEDHDMIFLPTATLAAACAILVHQVSINRENRTIII